MRVVAEFLARSWRVLGAHRLYPVLVHRPRATRHIPARRLPPGPRLQTGAPDRAQTEIEPLPAQHLLLGACTPGTRPRRPPYAPPPSVASHALQQALASSRTRRM